MRQSFNVTHSIVCRVLSCAWLLLVLGCEGGSRKEISSSTSGYRPSETNSDPAEAKVADAKPAATTLPPATTQTPPKNDNSATVSRPGSEGTPNGLPTAPTPPDFEPGKLDPAIANRDFMKLALPDSKDAEALVAYLKKNSRSMQELMAEMQKRTITRDIALKRGMELGRDRVSAADALAAVASKKEQKSMASIAKLEALAQMTSMGDVIAADDLRAAAQKELKNEDPEIAEQAVSILLAFSIKDFQSGSTKEEDLVKVIEQTLSSESLGQSALASIGGAIDALERKSGTPRLELAKKIEAAFRDHKDNGMSMTAWQLLANRTASLEDLMTSLESEDSNKGELIDAKVQKAFDDLPSRWTIFYFAQMSTQLEYSGRVEAAKAFIRFAESKIDTLPTENAKEELKQNSEKFWKRVNVLGSEIDFSELADVEGKAFSLDDYKGKVVVVDVWATWCNPCIEELPNLRNLYKDQQTKGLEIIGINVDEDSARLAAFLSSEKLPWKTYVSSNAEKREFETPAVSRLGISAIPFIAVIGKDGKVAAIHLRGRALEKKVLEMLAAQP